MLHTVDLTAREIDTLQNMRVLRPPGRWIEVRYPSMEFRQAIDMLVLSGLVERREDHRAEPFGPRGWLNEWRLTTAGIEAADYRPQPRLIIA